jgi:hypothetical protein
MVDKVHIDLLATLVVEGPGEHAPSPATRFPIRYLRAPLRPGQSHEERKELSVQVHRGDETQIGQLLARENARNLRARYEDADRSGMVPEWADAGYVHERRRCRLSAVEGLKAIDGYEYQACEADDWPDTEAAQLCQALRLAVIHELPGYSAAPWTWTAEDLARRVTKPPEVRWERESR